MAQNEQNSWLVGTEMFKVTRVVKGMAQNEQNSWLASTEMFKVIRVVKGHGTE